MAANVTQFCPNSFIPTFKMTCPGALTLIEIMNWTFLFVYFYFTAVVYEHYVRGMAMPELMKLEALEIENAKAAQKKAKEAKAVATIEPQPINTSSNASSRQSLISNKASSSNLTSQTNVENSNLL
jgi:hypothetical protein